MVNFLPLMSVKIRARGLWRAPSSAATSTISRRQCCSPTCAVSADLQMSFRRKGSLNSLMPFSIWWSLASPGAEDVLKYIGDAVIAIFPVTGADPARACTSALAAAQTTLAALQALPPEIRRLICIDIALHYGDAAYGNIGSGDRLDFTAVGRDINILSRLEL